MNRMVLFLRGSHSTPKAMPRLIPPRAGKCIKTGAATNSKKTCALGLVFMASPLRRGALEKGRRLSSRSFWNAIIREALAVGAL